MGGILMSIFTDFIAFKSSLLKYNRKNSWTWEVLGECGFHWGINELNI